jgi:hypothetical protein
LKAGHDPVHGDLGRWLEGEICLVEDGEDDHVIAPVASAVALLRGARLTDQWIKHPCSSPPMKLP